MKKILFGFVIVALTLVAVSCGTTKKTTKPLSKKAMLKRDLYGYVETDALYPCDYADKKLKVAIMPFEEQGKCEATYKSGRIIQKDIAKYLSRMGWTVIGEERTNLYLDDLKNIIEDNVREEREIIAIKEKVGADIVVKGTVYSFQTGQKGSTGTQVHFEFSGQLLNTQSEKIIFGTANSNSGAYSFDKSPLFVLREAMNKLFEEFDVKKSTCE